MKKKRKKKIIRSIKKFQILLKANH